MYYSKKTDCQNIEKQNKKQITLCLVVILICFAIFFSRLTVLLSRQTFRLWWQVVMTREFGFLIQAQEN